jgi:hypothetical protein
MRWLFVLAALGGPALPLVAQPQPTVAVGSKVRLRIPAANGRFLPRFDGTVVGVSGDTLTLRPKQGGGSRIYTPSYEDQLLVVTAQRSAVGRGVVIGALTGVLTAGIVLTLKGPACTGNGVLCFIRRDTNLRNAVVLGSAGALIGAAIGALSPQKTWTRAWMPPAQPVLSMGGGGLGMGMSVAF